MQKFPTESFSAQVRMAFNPARPGDAAGLVVFGYDYSWLGLVRDGDELLLQQRVRKDARDGGTEVIEASERAEPGALFLRVDVGPGGASTFSISRDGIEYRRFGKPFTARESRWVGAKLGLFSGNLPLEQDKTAKTGFADFNDWRVSER